MINVAFIVHSLDQGLLVAKIATEENKPAIILSAPGAGASLGPVVFSQMVSLIAKAYPKAKISGLLNCGSEAGIAMTAIRRGTTDIYFAPSKKEILKKLEQLAIHYGVNINCTPKNSIDLEGLADTESSIRSHLYNGIQNGIK